MKLVSYVMFMGLILAMYGSSLGNAQGKAFFKLFTNKNFTHGLSIDESSVLTNIDGYSVTHRSYFVIHGYQASTESEWVTEMAKTLLQYDRKSNVFVVDWSNVAVTPSILDYEKVVINMNQSVREIRSIAKSFIDRKYLTVTNGTLDVHCIGHSMGSHVCGLVSKLFFNDGYRFRRISAMDPAGPCFEKYSEQNRLTRTDAAYVDAIHTSSTFGFRRAIGHTDFYPNDGANQPGCLRGKRLSNVITFFVCGQKFDYATDETDVDKTDPNKSALSQKDVTDFFSCSHSRAITYYIESIKDACYFTSYECSNWANFRKSLCTNCQLNTMGFFSIKPDVPTYYYLYVNSKKPHCISNPLFDAYNYEVNKYCPNASPNPAQLFSFKTFLILIFTGLLLK